MKIDNKIIYCDGEIAIFSHDQRKKSAGFYLHASHDTNNSVQYYFEYPIYAPTFATMSQLKSTFTMLLMEWSDFFFVGFQRNSLAVFDTTIRLRFRE